ncbi:LysM peptidoglycan-binding domain-containing protein [Isoptericola cucumis]|uniref:LysM domain-containing protein n=1 Tax=Isoptericola cucumis TaxID=1776856 RepID=A0ABQ2B732_9MICO|nr:LysM peptidoglycan-binding domain-containing protein [Isoptericola cucumis]GGI07879.1 hypothetical protein GCM10007368_18380 [Isoptericola cucumis]
MASTPHAPGFLGLGGLRLTRRGRLVVVLLTVLVVAAAGLVGQQAVAGSPGGPLEVRLHTVAPGESLWEYARVIAGGQQDVREVVADLRDLNELDSADLQVGQVVLLPLE